MQAHIWGLKTFYYSLINKQGSKSATQDVVDTTTELPAGDDILDDDDCEGCKL